MNLKHMSKYLKTSTVVFDVDNSGVFSFSTQCLGGGLLPKVNVGNTQWNNGLMLGGKVPFKLRLYIIWFQAVDLWSQHSCCGDVDYTGKGKEHKIFSGIILHRVISSPKLRYDIFFSVGGPGTSLRKLSGNRNCTCSHLWLTSIPETLASRGQCHFSCMLVIIAECNRLMDRTRQTDGEGSQMTEAPLKPLEQWLFILMEHLSLPL